MSHKLIPTPVHQWLRKMPRPAFILADERKIPVPNGGRVWPSIWQTIAVINPKALQAIDAQGGVIRAMSLEGERDDTDEDDQESETQEEQWLKTFAKLLSDGYDKGSKASAPLLAEAMKFASMQAERLRDETKECERLRAENSKLRREILELTALPSQEGGEGGIWGQLLQGALMSPAGQQMFAQIASAGGAPPHANGKRVLQKEKS